MIIEEFSFGNFRSFKDIQTLRMSAAKITSRNASLDEQNVLTVGGKTKLLKSKVIYGANASGKSNVAQAMHHFIMVVKGCMTKERILVLMEPFLYSTESEKEPCFFQLTFFVDDVRYRYGFEASKEKIHSEWLYLTHNVREVPVFIRDQQEFVEVSKTHLTKGYDISRMKTKLLTDKILFLSMIETFEDPLAEKIIKHISSIQVLLNVSDLNEAGHLLAKEALKAKEGRDSFVDFLKIADISISAVGLSEQDKQTEEDTVYIISTHPKYDENLELVGNTPGLFDAVESDGTKQMLKLFPFITASLNQGHPLIVDEFGSQLHPLLAKHIISLYNSVGNKRAQIIAVTHTTELMSSDLLRRDQIDFVEKDKYGRCYVYTLVEIKGVRNTASFEHDYLQGKYGAIPFLGNWEELKNICDNTASDEQAQ